MAQGNKPIDKVRVGLVTGAIWRNESDGRSFYSATFSRSYKDEKNVWHDTDSFGADHILQLAKCADLTDTRIMALRAEDSAKRRGREEESR